MIGNIQVLEDDRRDSKALYCEGYQGSLSAAAHECRRSAWRGDDETRRGKATTHILNHIYSIYVRTDRRHTLLFGYFSIDEVCM
jgi:hypothetical protein